jgi:hypothetical protein
MLSFAEFDTFVKSLGEASDLCVSVTHAGRVCVEIRHWNARAGDWDERATATAGTFLEALEMAQASWAARRPKGVRGLLPPKRRKLRAVPSPKRSE